MTGYSSNQVIAAYAQSLNGISLNDWEKLEVLMNDYFRKKTGEFQNKLKFSGERIEMPNYPMFDK